MGRTAHKQKRRRWNWLPTNWLRSSSRNEWVTSRAGELPAFARLLTGGGNIADAAMDVLLFVTCFVTILVMAGRTAVGQFTFLTLTTLTGIAFFAISVARGSRVRLAWIDIPIFLALGLVAFQVLPLPAELIQRISPEVSEVLQIWGQGAFADDLPAWNTLSLAPEMTFRQLGLLAAGWLLIVVARHRLSEPWKLAAFLDLATIAMSMLAVFGILQLALNNGRFFWFYEYPYTGSGDVARGSFSNPNQFGGCLALGLAWPLWRVLSPIAVKKDEFGRVSSTPTYASFAAIAVMLPTILLTQSRVALVCAVVAVGGVLGLTMLQNTNNNKASKSQGKQVNRALLLLVTLAGAGALVLATFGDRLEADIERNMIELSSGDLEQLDYNGSRRSVWMTAIRGSADFPWFGAGLGAHNTLYPRYWEGPVNEKWYTHVENGPLQMLVETGRIGVLLIAAIFLSAIIPLLKALRQPAENKYLIPVVGTAVVLLVVNLAETITDFVWHVPGIMSLLLVVAAGAMGTVRKQASEYGPRIIPICGLLAVLAAASQFLPQAARAANAEPHWHSYVSLGRQEDPSARSRIMRLQALIRAHREDPDNPRVNSALAQTYLWTFDFGQERFEHFSLADLRDVIRGGGWDTPEEVQEWLRDDTVAGPTVDSLFAARRHALLSLRHAPLNSSAMLTLLKTNFLFDIAPESDTPIYNQLLSINDNSAQAHYEIGIEELRRGEVDSARESWKVAYTLDTRFRSASSRLIATVSTAEEFLETLNPDADALEEVDGLYAELLNSEGEAALDYARGLAWEQRALEQSHSMRRIQLLRKSCEAYEQAGQLEEAERVARIGVEIGPADIIARRMLGEILREQQKWSEAAEHLIWCSKVKGDDNDLRARAKECLVRAREQREPSVFAAPRIIQYR